MLSQKANLMKCIRGEVPDYLPNFTWGRMPGDKTKELLSAKIGPSILYQHREGERGGGLPALPGDELNAKKNRWIDEVISSYGRGFYKINSSSVVKG